MTTGDRDDGTAAEMKPAVAIVGAGPTGLMLAGELALAGVDVALLERRESQELVGQRAGGLHARTLEILDQRGIADRFLAEGTVYPEGLGFSLIPLHVRDFPTRHNYVLGLPQARIEHLLADWVRRLGVTVRYGSTVTGVSQDGAGVDVMLSDGRSLRARYLVGCDGGRSGIRKAVDIDFPGSEPSTSALIAEAELAEEPDAWGIRRDAAGIHSLARMADGTGVRILVTERQVASGGEPSLRELSEALKAAYGTDYGVHSPTSIARFTDATRQAARYRAGRVLLAGDAAHIHPPDGGQGVQLGMQDAMNLGWKLARVVTGGASDALLDSYHAERHPAAARVLRLTMASVALRDADERTLALRGVLAELLAFGQPRRHLAGVLSGLDVHYDLGEGHPLLGRRMPDLDIITTDGPRRVYSLLHDARPVLLDFADTRAPDIGAWAAWAHPVSAQYDGAWDLPVIGAVPPPSAVLIRPDGYVAWVAPDTP